MHESRRWTDEEFGYLVDNWGVPLDTQAADLGRSKGSVVAARKKIKDGWTPQRLPWTDAERDVLASNPYFTAEQLADLLPGRAVTAIAKQRSLLGVAIRGQKEPQWPGSRKVLAKTCLTCGLLLAGSWFNMAAQGTLNSYCKRCRYEKKVEREAALNPARQEERSRKEIRRANAYVRKAQEITLPLAVNNGKEYTEADHAILSDPSRSNLDKALALGRSYVAIHSAVYSNGYTSKIPMPTPEQEQWLIDNPNAERVDEIRAQFESMTGEMQMPELESVGARPEFEWED